MLGIQRRLGPLTLTCLCLLLALGACVVALWVGSVRGSSSRDSAAAPPTPDWFGPIWAAYDRDPAITPGFSFASLYEPSVSAVAEKALRRLERARPR